MIFNIGDMVCYSDETIIEREKSAELYKKSGLVEKALKFKHSRYEYFKVLKTIRAFIQLKDNYGEERILRASNFRLVSEEEIKKMKIKHIFYKI